MAICLINSCWHCVTFSVEQGQTSYGRHSMYAFERPYFMLHDVLSAGLLIKLVCCARLRQCGAFTMYLWRRCILFLPLLVLSMSASQGSQYMAASGKGATGRGYWNLNSAVWQGASCYVYLLNCCRGACPQCGLDQSCTQVGTYGQHASIAIGSTVQLVSPYRQRSGYALNAHPPTLPVCGLRMV